MQILRRLFVVPLANNDHGKSSLVRAVLAQGTGRPVPHNRPRGPAVLQSPWWRTVNALVFIRSFQEAEKGKHGTIENSLDAADADWRTRELILFPSHLVRTDVSRMVITAHANGFDAISVAVLLHDEERANFRECWSVRWDERWNVPNPLVEEGWEEQIRGLGSDLWTRICQSLGT